MPLGRAGLAQSTDQPPPRPAQLLPPSVSEAFLPAFLRRDIPILITDLKLDDGQQLIVETLFTDYEEAFSQGAAAARVALAQVRPSPADLDEIHEKLRIAMRDEIAQMLKALQEAQQENATADELNKIQQPFTQRIAELRAKRLEVWRQMAGDGGEVSPSIRLELLEQLDAWNHESQLLRDAFVSELTALLNQDQQALWPATERKLRRERLLPRGRLSGESLDLLALVGELQLSPSDLAAIQQTLDGYAVALDEALVAREQIMDQTQRDFYLATTTGDIDIARPLMHQQLERRIAVRNANEQGTDAVCATLTQENADHLRRISRQRSHPRVFRSTSASRALQNALDLEDLDETTRAAVEQIVQEYDAQLTKLNLRLMKAIRAQEPRAEILQLEQRLAKEGGEPVPPASEDAVRMLFQDRSTAGRVHLERLRGLLSPAQIAQVPALAKPVLAEQSEADPDDLRNRFDKNGDGHLSPSERQDLARYLFERQQGTDR
jgi:hypothetical protein